MSNDIQQAIDDAKKSVPEGVNVINVITQTNKQGSNGGCGVSLMWIIIILLGVFALVGIIIATDTPNAPEKATLNTPAVLEAVRKCNLAIGRTTEGRLGYRWIGDPFPQRRETATEVILDGNNLRLKEMRYNDKGNIDMSEPRASAHCEYNKQSQVASIRVR